MPWKHEPYSRAPTSRVIATTPDWAIGSAGISAPLGYPTEGSSMSKLNGKVAVITGGSSEMGLASTKRFLQAGAHVYITGRRQSELDKAKAEMGGEVTGAPGGWVHLRDPLPLHK